MKSMILLSFLILSLFCGSCENDSCENDVRRRVLLIIDVQNDFLSDGSIPVPKGEEVIPVFNKLRKTVHWDLIVLSQDFHPSNHLSFASNNPGSKINEIKEVHGLQQVMWPDHCVEGTEGAKFHKDLIMEKTDVVVQKGIHKTIDSYSAFLENDRKTLTKLDEILKEHGITQVYVGGLTYDFCVKYSALDSYDLGYETFFIEDATRGITKVGCGMAKIELMSNGVHVIDSGDIE